MLLQAPVSPPQYSLVFFEVASSSTEQQVYVSQRLAADFGQLMRSGTCPRAASIAPCSMRAERLLKPPARHTILTQTGALLKHSLVFIALHEGRMQVKGTDDVGDTTLFLTWFPSLSTSSCFVPSRIVPVTNSAMT